MGPSTRSILWLLRERPRTKEPCQRQNKWCLSQINMYMDMEWIEERCEREWGISKSIGCWQVCLRWGWHSCLPGFHFVGLCLGGLPIWETLRKRNITLQLCFFCKVSIEHSARCVINCPMSRPIWTFINPVWASTMGVSKTNLQWVSSMGLSKLSGFSFHN